MSFVIGEVVEVQWTDSKWYGAIVLQITPQINIQWVDGGASWPDVKPDKIRYMR